MTWILNFAIGMVLFCLAYILIRWPNQICRGSQPVSLMTFMAILFTSGLDMGLIIFPLTEFPTYESESVYGFTNPLAIEFGFWGFFIWSFYFLTTFYFCCLEPNLGFFKIPIVKFINNLIIITTCAFTAFLFLENISWYAPSLHPFWYYLLVFLIVFFSALSSTRLVFIKILSHSSTYLFFALILTMVLSASSSFGELVSTSSLLGGYFSHLHLFVFPISDYHAFYLFWWFAWSIMIGQFVSQFVPPMKTYQLFASMLVLPSIPLAVWFTILYSQYRAGFEITPMWRVFLVGVGILFVINSLDSLIRLYTNNLQWTVIRLGRKRYLTLNVVILSLLVLLYRFTPFEIEWVGCVVIALYVGALIRSITKAKCMNKNPEGYFRPSIGLNVDPQGK